MKSLTECIGHDIIQIYEDSSGHKLMHVLGYSYYAEGGEEPPWRILEWSNFTMPLQYYLETRLPDESLSDRADFWSCNTYLADVTEDEAAHFYDGARVLREEDLSLDTPDGLYVLW